MRISQGADELVIKHQQPVDELVPPKSFSEDERIHILAEITGLAAHSRENAGLYEGCLQKVFSLIPGAERATILIDFGGELRPVKYLPREQAYYSETLAAETREKKKAVSWLRKDTKGRIPGSMYGVMAAMYAPMIKNGKVIGVLHVDSTSLNEGFSKAELDLLSVIASILALSLLPTPSNPAVPSVFISYSHKDSKLANKIKGDLRRNGVSVWIDERLKAADEAWLKQLAVAIREQQYFLFLITGHSVASEYCQWELHTARSLKKEIVPLMLKKAEVPLTIASLQYIDFTVDYDQGFNLLAQTIHRKSPG